MTPPLEMPARQLAELMARPDALPTIQRLAGAVDPDMPQPELHVTLTAIAVLRARQAAEQIGARR